MRRHREKLREKESDPGTFTPEEAASTGHAFAFLWGVAVVPLSGGRVRALEPAETKQAGEVFHPLLKKYMPLLEQWQYEITAAIFLVGLVSSTLVPIEARREPEPEPEKTAA